MSTYATMQTRIARELTRSDLTDDIKDAITTAIQDYEQHRFWFNDKRFKIATVANQAFYDLPDDLLDEGGNALEAGEDLLEIDSALCNFNNWFQPLQAKSMGWIDAYQIPSYVGQPYYYGQVDTRIRFGPTPNGVYEITITGLARLKTLSENDDTNAWMTEGEKLIRSRAKVILYRDLLRNPDQAALAAQSEAEALASLDRKSSARHTQRLQAWGY